MAVVCSEDRVVTVIVSRPENGLEVLSMNHNRWMQQTLHVFFPDGRGRDATDHPLASVTLCCKWQGHFVLASEHKEKWILSSTRFAEIDMEYFGPEWKGCSASVVRA
jgi:hypothetical protein